MKIWIKLYNHLAENNIARNSHKEWYILYLQNYHCENDKERKVIEKVLSNALTGASYQRQVAYVQNTEWLYKADPDITDKRLKQREECREEYRKNNLFDAIGRWFKKN